MGFKLTLIKLWLKLNNSFEQLLRFIAKLYQHIITFLKGELLESSVTALLFISNITTVLPPYFTMIFLLLLPQDKTGTKSIEQAKNENEILPVVFSSSNRQLL